MPAGMEHKTAPTGLTSQQVKDARRVHGANRLPEATRSSPLVVFVRQFTSFLVVILIIAAAIAFVLGEVTDMIAIMLVVVLNGILGFVQEWRAETALESLRQMLSPQAMVIRDGAEAMIPADEIVPGDLIILNAGDRVPADAELAGLADVEIDESVLTGESVPVSRAAGEPVYAGTSLVQGRAEALGHKDRDQNGIR